MITFVTTRAKGPVGEWLFGKYLDWLRKEGGSRSQAEFARRLGIERALLNHYINGRRKPTGINITRLAVLGPEIYDLMELERPDQNFERLSRIFDMATQEQKEEIIAFAARLIGDIVDET